MIDQRPTELFGESITHWDEFYAANYQPIFESSLELVKTFDEAEKLTDRIFLKLLLGHPEIVVHNNASEVDRKVSTICPDLKNILATKRETSAKRLLEVYYAPN